MPPLPVDVRASYVVIIDGILAKSDLQTITSKRIREGLQQQVDYDITPQKNEIKALIMERFDKFAAERDAVPTTNGHVEPTEEPPKSPEIKSEPSTVQASAQKTGMKRPSQSDNEEEDEDAEGSSEPAPPSPPKKKRKAEVDEDAIMAARLQAEENSRARPTRGGSARKPPAVKKKKTPKKKTATKVHADDDSDLDGEGSAGERKVNRNTGFHKLLALSPPLSSLLEGETQMSRPQTVKRIWAYVKKRELQDPGDRRIIRCDDALRAVFKQDKVHMFTMNKILATQMYDLEA